MMLVLGADGQLGSAIGELLPNSRLVTINEIDLTDGPATIDALDTIEPEAIINCAAYTAVDRAEDNESDAFAVNADAVGTLAGYAATRSIRFLTYSTDYVFDGQKGEPYLETDSPNPINAYGRTKLAGEQKALQVHASGTLVIRTSWLISGTHSSFVSAILKKAQLGTLQVVSDQIGRPTVAKDLATASIAAVRSDLTGILHATNSGPAVSWYELASEIVRLAGMDHKLVEPCTTAQYPTVASRPRYSLLNTIRSGEAGVERLPDWRDSLPEVVSQVLETIEQ